MVFGEASTAFYGRREAPHDLVPCAAERLSVDSATAHIRRGDANTRHYAENVHMTATYSRGECLCGGSLCSDSLGKAVSFRAAVRRLGRFAAAMQDRSGRLVSALACTLALVLTASLAYGPPSRPALASRESLPGTCHLAADPNELVGTISDTAPAVPCDHPHQTETMWVQQVTGLLGQQRIRPNPELLHATLDRICSDYWRVRAYLGADSHDSHWGITTLVKVPTLSEWAHGDRTLRCEGLAGDWGADGPTLNGSMHGILRRAGSAQFRLCRLGTTTLTCDQPHDAEAISPNVVLPDAPWPRLSGTEVMATASCALIGEEYLGARLTSRPDLVVTFDTPTEVQWDGGDHSVNCWLANRRGQLTVGTVRGGLW